MGKKEFAKRYKKREGFLVEVYTTKHYVSALMIYEYIDTYIEQQRSRVINDSQYGSLVSLGSNQAE